MDVKLTLDDRPFLQSAKKSFFEIGPIDQILDAGLFDPISGFLDRPKKGFRKDLINLGLQFSRDSLVALSNLQFLEGEELHYRVDIFVEVIEGLHAGSLIIDDIEDQSLVRRGAPTLHRILGVPLALNAGNWLYFKPLQELNTAMLPASIKLRAYQEISQTLYQAHLGQTVDLKADLAKLTKEQIRKVVLFSTQYKSGALMALALKLGAFSIIRDFDQDGAFKWSEFNQKLDFFGMRLGQILQFYDDIGNFISNSNSEKHLEDLYLKRPSFLWIVLANHLNENEIKEIFHGLQHRAEKSGILDLFEPYPIRNWALEDVGDLQAKWMIEFVNSWPQLTLETREKVNLFIERIKSAYTGKE